MGVYGLSRATLAAYPAGELFGFDELVLDLLAKRTEPRHTPASPGTGSTSVGRRTTTGRTTSSCACVRGCCPTPMVDRRRILLLGANGFVGRHVRAALEESGDEVLGVSGMGASGLPAWRATDLASADLDLLVAEANADVVVNCAGRTHGGPDALATANVTAGCPIARGDRRAAGSPRSHRFIRRVRPRGRRPTHPRGRSRPAGRALRHHQARGHQARDR